MTDSIEMIRNLVRFPTTSDQPNRPLIDFAADWLDGLGADIRLFPDEDGRKANLFATFGPADVPGWVLSGHTDVVPADGSVWTYDPFDLTVDGDRIYGRGTTDMKGFVGIVLAMLQELPVARLRQPVHVALSYDEEIGCVGVRSMTDALAATVMKPRACIVGEPTEMLPVLGHKGKVSWRCDIQGRSAHSSTPDRGVNANELAARMMGFIIDLADDIDAMGSLDRYDPPRSTLVIGPMRGGTQLNVISDASSFEFECRHLPSIDPETVITRIRDHAARLEAAARTHAPETSVTITCVNDYPGFDIPPDHDVVSRIKRMVMRNDHAWVGFGTEAGLFSQAGIATVVCGPGSINQAHIIDEFLMLDQVHACERFIANLFVTARDGL